MSHTYSMWLGCQVAVHIETRESRVPLRGLVVNESGDALRFRIDGRWDVDIFKEMIVGIEADSYGHLPSSLGPSAVLSSRFLRSGLSGATQLRGFGVHNVEVSSVA